MDAKTPKAYIASALGFSELGRSAYYAALVPAIERAGYQVLDPWRLTAPAVLGKARAAPEGPSRRRAFRKVNAVIGGNNRRAIEACDVLVAILDGPDVDSGTAAEIGYAAGIGKRIVAYRNDFRLSADNEGAAVNLQVEYFIRQSGGRIAPDLLALERALRALRR
ncbi:MAG: nucleoside 2-deoxyribosyltransferase [Bryobacteraceae bacterium]|nr:nucleoside 2-deoxyribosyltransferase [Bryobacteraceae bacterium]